METRWTVTQTTLLASVLRMELNCEVLFSILCIPTYLLCNNVARESRSLQTMRMKCKYLLLSSEYITNKIVSIEASRRMVQNFDLVITSGGIGPTHDGMTP